MKRFLIDILTFTIVSVVTIKAFKYAGDADGFSFGFILTTAWATYTIDSTSKRLQTFASEVKEYRNKKGDK